MTCLHCDNGAYVQEVEGELYVVPCPWCADLATTRRYVGETPAAMRAAADTMGEALGS